MDPYVIICPQCGEQNSVGSLICFSCASDLSTVSLVLNNTSRIQSPSFVLKKLIVEPSRSGHLTVIDQTVLGVLLPNIVGNYIVGRSHPSVNFELDIDLRSFLTHLEKVQESYSISKQHAYLRIYQDGTVTISPIKPSIRLAYWENGISDFMFVVQPAQELVLYDGLVLELSEPFSPQKGLLLLVALS